jgi:hypothetical protein
VREEEAMRTILVAVPAAVLLFAPPEAGADCWRIPRECHSIELRAGRFRASLAGREHGLRSLSVARKGGDQQLLCLESVRSKGTTCGHYYYCRLVETSRPNAIDTDSAEQLEIRWLVKADQPLSRAEVRHALKNDPGLRASRWQAVQVSATRWTTISSSSPACSAATRERDR